MKIYISHSRNFDYKKELYEPIKESDLVKKYDFVFPFADTDTPLGSELIEVLKECDVIVAEISHASTGQGMELAWGSIFDIPIIGIYKEGANVSNSMPLVSNKLLMYTSQQNMIDDISGALTPYEPKN